MKKNDILCLLQYGTFKKLEKDSDTEVKNEGKRKPKDDGIVKDSTLRNLLLNLAITPETDIPYHLLVEEKHFLQHYMHLPMDQLSLLSDQSQVLLNEILNNKITSLPKEMENYIVNNEIKLTSIFELATFMDKLYKQLKTKDPKLFTLLCNNLLSIIHQLIELFPHANYYNEMQERIGNLKVLIAKNESTAK